MLLIVKSNDQIVESDIIFHVADDASLQFIVGLAQSLDGTFVNGGKYEVIIFNKYGVYTYTNCVIVKQNLDGNHYLVTAENVHINENFVDKISEDVSICPKCNFNQLIVVKDVPGYKDHILCKRCGSTYSIEQKVIENVV